MNRIGRCAAAAVFAAATLVGCEEGDPKPKISPSPTSSVSPSPSATSPTPEKETPEAFIRRWVDAYNTFERTGLSADFAKLNEKACDGCNRITSTLERVYAAGGYVRSDGWALDELIDIAKAAQQTTVTSSIRVSATRYKESSSSPQQTTPESVVETRFVLRPSGMSWRVASFERVAT